MHKFEIDVIKTELDRLVAKFFRAISFETGMSPSYKDIPSLFIVKGLLIKATGPIPETSTVNEFIAPREALISSGILTRFHEAEISEKTKIFGNVAHRFSVYEKSGVFDSTLFDSRGMITTQFVNTPIGWRMSSMAWDDERPGLPINEEVPKKFTVLYDSYMKCAP